MKDNLKDDFKNAALNPGSLLVFTSEWDPTFWKKVVLLLKHDERGSLGVIINRPDTEHNYEDFAKLEKLDVLKNQPPENRTFLDGGPVVDWTEKNGKQTGNIRVTFFSEDKNGGIASFDSTDKGKLKRAKELEASGNEAVRVALNYTGWGPGGLKAEVDGGAWRVLPPDADLVFRTEFKEIFPKAAAKAGIHPDVIRYIMDSEALRKEKGGFKQALDYIEPLRPKPPTR